MPLVRASRADASRPVSSPRSQHRPEVAPGAAAEIERGESGARSASQIDCSQPTRSTYGPQVVELVVVVAVAPCIRLRRRRALHGEQLLGGDEADAGHAAPRDRGTAAAPASCARRLPSSAWPGRSRRRRGAPPRSRSTSSCERRVRNQAVAAELGVTAIAQHVRIDEPVGLASCRSRARNRAHPPPVGQRRAIPRAHRRAERQKRSEQVEPGRADRGQPALRQRVVRRHEDRDRVSRAWPSGSAARPARDAPDPAPPETRSRPDSPDACSRAARSSRGRGDSVLQKRRPAAAFRSSGNASPECQCSRGMPVRS